MRIASRKGLVSVMLSSLVFTGCFSGRPYQANYPGSEFGHGFGGPPAGHGDCSHCRNRPPMPNNFWPDVKQPVPSGPVAKQLPPKYHPGVARAPHSRPGMDMPPGVMQTAYMPGGPQNGQPKESVQPLPPPRMIQGQPHDNHGKPGTPGDPSAPPIMVHDPNAIPPIPGPGPIPTELSRVSLPPYTVAPPDILFIDVLRLVPKPPYVIEALETLIIEAPGALPNQPIKGPFIVSPEGTINLGFSYGTVRVGGLTLDQANAAIRSHLGKVLQNPDVSVALAQIRAFQQIRGEHLVRPDGTISLGTYGSIYVAGLTIGQIKCVLERYLSDYVVDPKVSVDVFAYNSKVYYVIVDGAGFGQQVFPFPITGNETVLDAVAKVGGLAPQSSKRRIWVARPSPCHNGCNQLLPVDWRALTEGGSTCTNYQIFPGDRIYVAPDRLVLWDNVLAKALAPVERLLGITLLGATTYQAFTGNLFNNN